MLDIRSAVLDYFKHMVVIEQQSDLGPTEYQVHWCVDEVEATKVMIQALQDCPNGYTRAVFRGPIEWSGNADRR